MLWFKTAGQKADLFLVIYSVQELNVIYWEQFIEKKKICFTKVIDLNTLWGLDMVNGLSQYLVDENRRTLSLW